MSYQQEPTMRPDLEAAVGRRVRLLREARGWSQQQLGQRLASWGYPMEQPTVYKLEKGTRPLRLNEIVALAAVLNVPMEQLISPPNGLDEHLDAALEVTRMAERVHAAQERARAAQASEHVARRAMEQARKAYDEALADYQRAVAAMREGDADRGEHRPKSGAPVDHFAEEVEQSMRRKP